MKKLVEMIFIMRNYFQILNLWKLDIQKTVYYKVKLLTDLHTQDSIILKRYIIIFVK